MIITSNSTNFSYNAIIGIYGFKGQISGCKCIEKLGENIDGESSI